MSKRTTISAILIGTFASAPLLADDGDVLHARVLLEEARTFGVPSTTGLAAGTIVAEREERERHNRRVQDARTENDRRWDTITEQQSKN